MTCRHEKNDPRCSTQFPNTHHKKFQPPVPPGVLEKARELLRKGKSGDTPDASEYDIEDAVERGENLVLKVKYPSCVKCSYEGVKVMVFLNKGMRDALRWKSIDPHFRGPAVGNQAPSPDARFPGSEEGWADALAYAEYKGTS